MENQFESFIKVLQCFDQFNVDYVLIGGVAMVLHGMERLTRDIDMFINPDQKNIENIRSALFRAFKDHSIEEITLEEFDKYPVIRYGTPEGFYIDLLVRIEEMFTYKDLEYEILNFQGIKIKIATPQTLYQLKKDTIRDRDKIDVIFLQEIIRVRNLNQSDK